MLHAGNVDERAVVGGADHRQSLKEPTEAQPRAGVVEVNASPGLWMHHFPMDGTPRNIAGLVLAHVVQKLGGLRAP